MLEWVLALGALLVVGVVVVRGLAAFRARERITLRLEDAPIEAAVVGVGAGAIRFEPSRFTAMLIGAIAAALFFVWARSWSLSAAFGLVIGTITWTIQDMIASTRVLKLEQQLADLLDLVVGTLRAGIGVIEGLESAAKESRPPLRPLVEESITRIRLGDNPQDVFTDMRRRVPLESFRLFAFALAVHWEAGGSLAPTLASVARAVRDRIEITRRARAQAAEAQFSVIGILFLIYVLGYLMWRLEPERLEQFLAWQTGAALVTGVVVLQAIGLLWMRKLSRVET